MAFDPKEYLGSDVVEEKPKQKTSGKFDPTEYLSETVSEPIPTDTNMLATMAAPATTALAYSTPAGFNAQAVKSAVQPLIDIAPKTYRQYMAPGGVVKGALDILGIGTVGVPPVAGIEAAKAIAQIPSAVSESASRVSQVASQGAQTMAPGGYMRSETIPEYRNVQDALRKAGKPELATQMSELYNTKGGNNAVAKFLASNPEVQALAQADQTIASTIGNYTSKIPSTLSQIGKVVKPLVVGAARVAGPVGTAMQVAEAMPYMEQSQIGQRTRTGEVGQLMRGSRNMMLNQPTPQPLSPNEMENLLASGDIRLINMYGGENAVKMAIRRKAAEKVLGR